MISIFVYPKSATASDLLTNGYGRIECTKCDVSEDINADFYAEIEVPRGSVNEEYVIGGAILKIPCHRGFQYFRIGLPEQNLSVIKVKAWHISYDLAADMIINSWWDAKTAQEALTGILHAGLTETRFSGTTDITTSANLRSVRSSVLSTLIDSRRDNSFVKVWGGEAYRDNFTFDMRSSLGSDGGVRIAYKKNLTGLDIKEDWTQIATRIVPTCLSSADGVLSLPETFIDSTKINDYPYPYVRTIHYSDIKVGQETDGVVLYPDEASAFAAMRERVADLYAAGADIPKTTATVTFAELSKTREYAQYAALESVGLGDTVTAVYRTVALKNRVRGIKFDALTQKITSVTLGDPSRNTLLTTMYAHDVDLSALKSEVTQTVKQGDNYNNVYINHSDGFVAENDTLGVKWKANATQTGFYKIVDDSFLGGAAVINSIVTMVAGAMTNDIASGYYSKTGTILDGGVTRHGVGFYNGPTLKWFLCQYEVGAFHSIALYDENLIPRISLDADGACYIRDAAGRKRQYISASGDFSVWDAADKERMRISASGEFLVWDAEDHLRQWIKGDNSILYSPNGANLMYVNDTNAYKNIGGVVSIL